MNFKSVTYLTTWMPNLTIFSQKRIPAGIILISVLSISCDSLWKDVPWTFFPFHASGVLNYLKETFTHTPSYDMSPAMLSVLVKMMLAQAQECVFEQICLPGIRNEFFTLVKLAQEVAKVGFWLTSVRFSYWLWLRRTVPYMWTRAFLYHPMPSWI